jgi:general stress protein YciG
MERNISTVSERMSGRRRSRAEEEEVVEEVGRKKKW